MARIITLIVFLALLICGLFFGVLNADAVTLNYYWGQSQVPLSLLLVIMMIIGAAAGVVASLAMSLKLRHQNAQLRRQLREQEKELANLRAIPLKNNR